MKRYLMEAGYLARLRAERKELISFARAFKTADEVRKAGAELMAATRINLAPKADADLSTLYSVDAEGVAHIPVVGELTPAAQKDWCGAYTAEALTEYGYIVAALRAADADPRVLAVALDINSPGGYADGVDEAAQAFAAVSKPTTATVGTMAASAAYWIASQADRIVALSPMSEVGSIGVAAEEFDDDRALAEMGIDHRIYTSTDAPDKRPDTKTEGGRAKIVEWLDGTHNVFVQRVTAGRHTTVEDVRKNYGHGALVIATEALRRGMIDEIKGMDIQRKPAAVGGSAARAANIKSQEVRKMDLTQLKAEHPEVYDAAKAEAYTEGEAAGINKGVADGVAQERKRLEQLNAFRGINADGDKAVDEAIRAGKAYADVAPLIAAATAKGKGVTADGDNPPDVATAAQAAAGGAGMSAEDRAWYLGHGVKPEELAKFGADAGKEKK